MTTHVSLFAAHSDTPSGSVPGFCLAFESRDLAQQALGMSTASVVEGRLPPTDVEISRSIGRQWSLHVRAITSVGALDVEIPGISESEVEAFLELLARVQYYFIMFAWVNVDGTLGIVDPAGDVLFKSTIVVNQQVVKGGHGNQIDWRNVFGDETHLILGSWQ